MKRIPKDTFVCTGCGIMFNRHEITDLGGNPIESPILESEVSEKLKSINCPNCGGLKNIIYIANKHGLPIVIGN